MPKKVKELGALDVKRMEAAGVSAVVMYSLFEEQIIHESLELDHYLSRSANFSSVARTVAWAHRSSLRCSSHVRQGWAYE